MAYGDQLRSGAGRLPEGSGVMPDPSGGLALPHEVVERPGDADDLVHGPRSGADHDDEQVASHAGPPRLGRDRREAETPGRVVLGEAGERHALAVLREDENLLLMTVGDEEPVRRAEPEAGGDGATMHDAGGPLRGELHDLTGTLLDRRLRGAVAADPEPVAVVDGKEARPGDREMARVDDPAVGVEPDDEALGAIGDVDVSRAVDRDALGLPQDRLAAPLRRAAGEQLGAPVDQAIERADSPLAVERRDEQLARAPGAGHLRIRQGRPVEVARLGVGGQARAPD